MATSLSAILSTSSVAGVPLVVAQSATFLPSSSPKRRAAGASEYLDSGAPLGRPKCANTTTRAPRSDNALIVGTLAWMRPSSVMVVPSSGTLRSLRTITVLPATSSWSIPRIDILESVTHIFSDVNKTVGITPFIVVPADNFGGIANHFGQCGIKDA
ncbi:unannotated protein [freshwater metagenome]|uniref:Unannotated protein n=1 Tax=freshwater metagenome TaxID=449393 RepID=A0A6J5ZRM3_9ZZZZ